MVTSRVVKERVYSIASVVIPHMFLNKNVNFAFGDLGVGVGAGYWGLGGSILDTIYAIFNS